MNKLDSPRNFLDDLQRTRRDLGSYADYSGPWRICLFRRAGEGPEPFFEPLDIADACTDDDRAAADAAAELRTTVLIEPASQEEFRSILAVPILDPLIIDPSPLQQYVLGVVTFASGVSVETWAERYEFQMIAGNYAQRLAAGIID